VFYKITVHGTVQGVGFRPFIYREAVKRGLKGYVKNVGGGVEIIVNDKDFVRVLDKAPPLAVIEDIKVEKTVGRHREFEIIESSGTSREVAIPPDISVCRDCLRELRDGEDRRHNYYYTTCTNCGPRYSIIEDFSRPYDRPTTTMRDFSMCGGCGAEYTNPLNRRYHAQTIACPKCGPRLRLTHKGNVIAEDFKAIVTAAGKIKEGFVVAVKGNGGFHLACLTTPKAVKGLRKLTGRKKKPYAVMMKDMDMTERYCRLTALEKKTLKSPQAPIVIARKKKPDFMKEVSELYSLGVMLPYTALHTLLFEYVNRPVVMTSANLPDEPVSKDGEDVGGYCDYVLAHGRRIANRCDDSVVKDVGGGMVFLRRSRGYVPAAIRLECGETLALGAEWENTITVTANGRAFMSQYVGSTGNLRTFEYLKKTVKDYLDYTGVNPGTILCDMHPDFMTTEYARQLAGEHETRLVRVQHHLAHVSSVAAENNLKEFVGIACDGYGYGMDGTAWGGEVFLNDQRKGCLEIQALLGGDYAAKKPRRMLFSIMNKYLDEQELEDTGLFTGDETRIWSKQLREKFNVIETTSTGRLLDSITVLLGYSQDSMYRGQHPMILESMAGNARPYRLRPEYGREDGLIVLKTTPLLEYIHSNLGKDKHRLAATAHHYLAEGLYEMAAEVGEGEEIVFSGGVAYNSIITRFMLQHGVLVNTRVPCGDGGISFGQAAYFSIFGD
jgi:hydrogenase maturation protein HypF